MKLWKSWAIARKDFRVFRRKPSILYSLVAFPIAIAIGLPAIVAFAVHRRAATYAQLLPLTDAFAFFFLISTIVIATTLAAYSIVGEKVEKSLEPLLATPTTDEEILLGKVLASFLPTFGSTALGIGLFMVVMDALSRPQLGYLLYPNETMAVLLLAGAPLAALYSVEANILVSSRVSDVRTAQQTGSLFVLPFAALYVLGEIQVLTLDTTILLDLSAALAVADVGLFFLSRATFRREAILTRWH